jgi:glycosyltransferase involved in cell wall biosynthesis
MVSFIIPSLNQGRYLRNCIDSCLSQSIVNREIIVQDGGSSDNSLEILRSYGSELNVSSAPDDGQSDAVNKAIARSNGDIIAWVNSDDYYARPDVLERVCRTFEESPDVEIVFGDGLFVDCRNQPLRSYKAWQFESVKALISTPSSPLAQPAVFFRRELFLQVGGLRNDLHWALDFELWLRLFTVARNWKYIPDNLACMTWHGEAKSTRGMAKQIAETRAIKLEFIKQYGHSCRDRLFVEYQHLQLYGYRLVAGTWLTSVWWSCLRWLRRGDRGTGSENFAPSTTHLGNTQSALEE